MKLSDVVKSKVVKEAKKGHDFGKKNKKGTGFKSLTHKLEKEGKSKKSANKIAGAQFWKQIGK